MTLLDQAAAIQAIETEVPAIWPAGLGIKCYSAEQVLAVLRGLPPATPTPEMIAAGWAEFWNLTDDALDGHASYDASEFPGLGEQEQVQWRATIEAALRAAHTQPEPTP